VSIAREMTCVRNDFIASETAARNEGAFGWQHGAPQRDLGKRGRHDTWKAKKRL